MIDPIAVPVPVPVPDPGSAAADGVAPPPRLSRRAALAGGLLSVPMVLGVGGRAAAAPAAAIGAPGEPAGGVLSGTYPNPGFAVPMATGADLAAAVAAHGAAIKGVHGIEDTAELVRTGDPRLGDERPPPDGGVTVPKLAVGVLRGDVRSYGAVGDGTADDTAAIQAALDASEALFLPHGTYRITDTLRLRNGTHLYGEGMGGQDRLRMQHNTSVIDATDVAFRGQRVALQGVAAGVGLCMENLLLTGPTAQEVWPPGDFRYGSTGIDVGYSAQGVSLRHLRVVGFAQGIHLAGVAVADLVGVYVSDSRNHCLNIISLSGQVTIVGGVYSNAAGVGTADRPANIYIGEGAEGPEFYPRGVTLVGTLVDESFGEEPSGVRVDHAEDVNILSCTFINPYQGYGLYVGGASERVRVSNTRIRPYHPSYPSRQTIRIEPGARDCALSFVSTDPHGGGDILDEGTGTVYQYVNSAGRSEAIPAPAGGVVADGEAREAIGAMLSALRNAGITA